MDTSNFGAMLEDSAHGWALAATTAEQRAEQIRTRAKFAVGSQAESEERARIEAEAAKQDRLAAAYRSLTEESGGGFLVIPAGMAALDPGFMQRYEDLIRVASAANRIVHRH